MAAQYCPACGAPLSGAYSRFCPHCGADTPGFAPPGVSRPIRVAGPAAGPLPPGSSPPLAPPAAFPAPPASPAPLATLPREAPPASPARVAPPPPAGLAGAGGSLARHVSAHALAGSLLMLALEISGAYVLFALTGSLTARGPLVAPESPTGALIAALYESRHWLPLDPLFASTFGFQAGDAAGQRTLSYSLVQSLLALLSTLIPVVGAGVYWSALYRTSQQRRSFAWIGTALWLALGLPLLVALIGAAASLAARVSDPGSQSYGPSWAAVLVICLPGALVLLAAVAAVAAIAGEVCAALFGAIAPSGNSTSPRRPPSVLAVVLLSALQVMLIYGLSASLMQGYSSQWEWFPLGALLLTVVVSLNHLLPAS